VTCTVTNTGDGAGTEVAWHIREETYAAALSQLINAHRTIPLAQLWGTGTTSSSDGQYFKAGGRGEKLADINARHGNEPGVTFYTHLSDQFGLYYTKVIAATALTALVPPATAGAVLDDNVATP